MVAGPGCRCILCRQERCATLRNWRRQTVSGTQLLIQNGMPDLAIDLTAEVPAPDQADAKGHHRPPSRKYWSSKICTNWHFASSVVFLRCLRGDCRNGKGSRRTRLRLL